MNRLRPTLDGFGTVGDADSVLRSLVVLGLVMLSAAPVSARPQASDLVGRYWLPGRIGQMEIVERDGAYYGTVVETRVPNLRDERHPDPALRDRPVVGVEVLSGFRYERRRWVGGTVYDPRTGHHHEASLWFEAGDRRTLFARSPRGPDRPGWTRRFERVAPAP